MTDDVSTGKRWEDFAARFVSLRGTTIIARRYRCRFGEIDLIGRQKDALVIFEVRARRRAAIVSALESVDASKQRKIRSTARFFLARHPALADLPTRFDIVAIEGIDCPKPRVRWIQNAFD